MNPADHVELVERAAEAIERSRLQRERRQTVRAEATEARLLAEDSQTLRDLSVYRRRERRSQVDADGLARRLNPRAGTLPWLWCAECGAISDVGARGWRGYLTTEEEISQPPGVAYFCLECATLEFGP